jgi:hypothetical protein
MHDVEAQLRTYFDSNVERIDAEDVMAGARVTNQLKRWNGRVRHPLRIAAAAATLVTVAIGLVVVGAWMLGEGAPRIGEANPTPTATAPVATTVWPIALAGIAAAIAAIATLTIKKRKGGSVDTLERQTPEVRIEHLRKSNRGLIIALVVTVLALAGLGGWVLFDKVIDTGIEADVQALLDEFLANANAGDPEANTDLYTSRGVYIEGDGTVYPAQDIPAHWAALEGSLGQFAHEQLGDPLIIEDPDANRYFVSVPGQIGWGRDPYYKHFLTFVLTEVDGELKIISQMVSPLDNWR